MPPCWYQLYSPAYLLLSSYRGMDQQLAEDSDEKKLQVWSEKTSAVVSELLVIYLWPRRVKTVQVALRTCQEVSYQPDMSTLIWGIITTGCWSGGRGVQRNYDNSSTQKIGFRLPSDGNLNWRSPVTKSSRLVWRHCLGMSNEWSRAIWSNHISDLHWEYSCMPA